MIQQAQETRHRAALVVESAYHGGYKRPLELGGGAFVCVALAPYAGWHRGANGWFDRVTHSGDKEAHKSWEERFEHPARTWASVSHRQFTIQSVSVAMAEATYKWMEASACRRCERCWASGRRSRGWT